MPLLRVLEPEVMDSPSEAVDYDSMDHRDVNRRFVDDFLAVGPLAAGPGLVELLDLGTGTAQIPLELCRRASGLRVLAVDRATAMLAVAAQNLAAAKLTDRIELAHADAKRLPYESARFAGVISNSIVHHIPDPGQVLAEAVRVVQPGGTIFFRDLLRPPDDEAVRHLVATYAGDANPYQRQMFDDSLRAALSLDEIRALVRSLGFAADTVQATSDRHWTWNATRPG
jgi:ubiquinone/menaquinone biosynthesis C-methylase UbiE